MKNSNIVRAIALLSLAAAGCGSVAADSLANPSTDVKGKRSEYVKITGSLIPQKVQVKSIGTATTSNLRVIGRNEIDKTGRYTTAGAVAQDPSVRVSGY